MHYLVTMFTNAVTDMVGDEMLDCSKSSRVHSLGLQEFSMSIWHEFKSISNDATMQHKMQKVVHPSAIGTNMDVDLIWT